MKRIDHRIGARERSREQLPKRRKMMGPVGNDAVNYYYLTACGPAPRFGSADDRSCHDCGHMLCSCRIVMWDQYPMDEQLDVDAVPTAPVKVTEANEPTWESIQISLGENEQFIVEPGTTIEVSNAKTPPTPKGGGARRCMFCQFTDTDEHPCGCKQVTVSS
jgi:hypothetical protein